MKRSVEEQLYNALYCFMMDYGREAVEGALPPILEKVTGEFRAREQRSMVGLDDGIEELDLSVRTFNSLKRAGYHTVRQIVAAENEPETLLAIRSFGQVSLIEITNALNRKLGVRS